MAHRGDGSIGGREILQKYEKPNIVVFSAENIRAFRIAAVSCVSGAVTCNTAGCDTTSGGHSCSSGSVTCKTASCGTSTA